MLILFGLGLFAVLFIITALLVIPTSLFFLKKEEGGFDGFLKKNKIIDYTHHRFWDGTYLVQDHGDGIIWFYNNNTGYIGYYYSQITGVKLQIDDSTEYKSSVTSAVSRAVVGGALAGGIGAIIGGVTGQKNARKVVHKVELVVSTNDWNNPFYTVTLLNDRNGKDINGYEFRDAHNIGMAWSKRMDIIISNNEGKESS
ncbi:hypothetical protein RYX56_06285 [Alkalihalophilus lindianensis]|uniref:Uncharacterized protein n=1 Tax=Alkalihalophilus lindianensis TaxID=1630542 RepID=A0ABU3X7Y3_9BACI|nr:hypothetical protein [Alkalihalophilus lindianensis]MDV2683979.1 hypothetical protein [Alkalihalophilus lindianensis]